MSSILEAAKILLDQTREVHDLRDKLKTVHRTLKEYRSSLVHDDIGAAVVDELLEMTKDARR